MVSTSEPWHCTFTLCICSRIFAFSRFGTRPNLTATNPTRTYSYYSVSRKKTKKYLVISTIKLGRIWWNLVHSFGNELAANISERFPPRLSNVSTLPCELKSVHRARATIELLKKETPEFTPPQLWRVASNSPDLMTECGECCKRRCSKYSSLIWTNWNSDWVSELSWIMSSLRQPFVRGVVDSSRSAIQVLYTCSRNIPTHCTSNGFKSGEFGGRSWGGINFGVTFSDNSVVARVRWAF